MSAKGIIDKVFAHYENSFIEVLDENLKELKQELKAEIFEMLEILPYKSSSYEITKTQISERLLGTESVVTDRQEGKR